MYKTGDIEKGRYTDARTDDYHDGVGYYLPHSCQEWVIGSDEEVKLLIKDLQDLLTQ